MAEQGLLGKVLSLCEDVCVGSEPLSPWAREGGYGRAPGYEREDHAKQKSFTMDQRNREMASHHSKQVPFYWCQNQPASNYNYTLLAWVSVAASASLSFIVLMSL